MQQVTEFHQPPPLDDLPLTQRSYLSLALSVAKRRNFVLSIVLAVFIGSAVIALLLPKIYTATVRIMPPQQSQSSAMNMMGQLTPLLSVAAGKDLALRNQNDLYVAMLRSNSVEDQIIDQFQLKALYNKKLYEDARRELESNTNIAAGKEGIISVSVDDRDPHRAAEIANGYVAALEKVNQTLAVSDAAKRRLFFERQVNRAKEDLAVAENALKQTEQRTGIIHLDSQSRLTLEWLSRLQGEAAAKEMQIQAMRSYATAENPQIQLAEQELSAIRAQIAHLAGGNKQESAGDLPLEKVPGAGLEYLRSWREVKYREALFEFLTKSYEEAQIDEARDASVIQVLDRAQPPERRSRPHRTSIVLLATLFAFMVSVTWVFVSEILERSRENPENLAQIHLLKTYLLGRHPH